MKEVGEGCFAGPFHQPPFENFVQSPIGLVPKDGNKTRLIFHLSYDFQSGNSSINSWTPDELCSVHYNDLDDAVANALYHHRNLGVTKLCMSKTDLKSAFRGLPIFPGDHKYLVLKAEDPQTGKVIYFVDKCLPFGSSISCAHFQCFSNALAHIHQFKTDTKKSLTNYLDDFLFLAATLARCNYLMRRFLEICKTINFPVSEDKTVWATGLLVFPGILLDGKNFRLCLPEDKRIKALNLLQNLLNRKKATVKELQKLTGTLNFLCSHTSGQNFYQKNVPEVQ